MSFNVTKKSGALLVALAGVVAVPAANISEHALSNSFFGVAAHAAEAPSTNLQADLVKPSSGETISQTTPITINWTWDVPDNAVTGDTTVFTVDNYLNFNVVKDVPIYDGTNIIGYGNVVNNTFVVTYTDYVDNNSNVSGQIETGVLMNDLWADGTTNDIHVFEGSSSDLAGTLSRVIAQAAPVPVANNDNQESVYPDPITVDVLANDTIATGAPAFDTSTLVLNNSVDGKVTNDDGTWEVVNGKVVFTPAKGFHGETTPVTYTVTDTADRKVSADVTINVTTNPPKAVDDSVPTDLDTPVTIDILANDTAWNQDFPLDASTISLTDSDESQGTWEIIDGKVVFTPAEGFVGDATVTYTVADSTGSTTTAVVTVTVEKEPALPESTDDTVTTPQDTPVTIDVLANDKVGDAPFDLSALEVAGDDESQGTWEIIDGKVKFTPAEGFVGDATATYLIVDENGESTHSTITVTVEKEVVDEPNPTDPPTTTDPTDDPTDNPPTDDPTTPVDTPTDDQSTPAKASPKDDNPKANIDSGNAQGSTNTGFIAGGLALILAGLGSLGFRSRRAEAKH